MATISDIKPNEGDCIAGSDGRGYPVCIVDGELFWAGQFLSAYGGDCFSVVSRSDNTVSAEALAQREVDKSRAVGRHALDKKYM